VGIPNELKFSEILEFKRSKFREKIDVFFNSLIDILAYELIVNSQICSYFICVEFCGCVPLDYSTTTGLVLY
jgi:hypothetical protein